MPSLFSPASSTRASSAPSKVAVTTFPPNGSTRMTSYSVTGPGGTTSSMRTEPALKSATSDAPASRASAATITSVSRPARLRTVDSRPSSGSVAVATTASGAKPSRRNAAKPRSVHCRATASTAGSAAIVSSITCSRVATTGRVPGAPNVSDTIASERTFASAFTMGTKRGPRNMSQFSCSCPPSTTSMPGTAVTNSVSCASDRCVSATMASVRPRSFSTSAFAAAMASR